MHFEKILPNSNLKEFIRFYWFLEGEEPSPQFKKILPFGALDMIIHKGTPMSIKKNGGIRNEPQAFIEGQYLSYHKKRPSANTQIVGVSIQPWASKLLFGVPSVDFTGEIVDTRNLNSKFEELISIALAHNEREFIVQRMDDFFLGQLMVDSGEDYNHLRLFASVLLKFDDLAIEELAKKFWGNSFRGLQIQFKEAFGITLSDFRRKKRLQKAIEMMNEGIDTLTHTALSVGFYDQAHFTRSFRDFAGVTPSAYLKERSKRSETMMGELFS